MTGPSYLQDESGATLDSGVSACRFSAALGGRIEHWQWRATPPLEAIAPGAGRREPRVLELVDPAGGALVDHFLPLGTLPRDIAAATYTELGDFADGEYRFQVVDTGGEVRIGLLRDGALRAGKRVSEVRMAKSAALRHESGDVAALYRVINSSLKPLQVLFAVELNLFAPGLHEPGSASHGYYLIDGARPDEPEIGSSGVTPGVTHVALANPEGEMALQLGWDRECDLWRLPSAGGRSARLFAVWRIQLPPRDNWAMGLWLAPS